MKLTEALERFEKCRKALRHSNVIDVAEVGSTDFETLVLYLKALKRINDGEGVLPNVDLYCERVTHTTCTGNTSLRVEESEQECGEWRLNVFRGSPWEFRKAHMVIHSLGWTTGVHHFLNSAINCVVIDEAFGARAVHTQNLFDGAGRVISGFEEHSSMEVEYIWVTGNGGDDLEMRATVFTSSPTYKTIAEVGPTIIARAMEREGTKKIKIISQ